MARRRVPVPPSLAARLGQARLTGRVGHARPLQGTAVIGWTRVGVGRPSAPRRPPRCRRSEACRARTVRFRLAIACRCTGPFCRL